MIRSVLVTRSQEDAAHLTPRLLASGYTPILAPLFRVTQQRISTPPGVQAILVTSRNAVAALAPSAIPLLAVGDATAARAAAHGFANVASAAGDAVALAGLATSLLRPGAGALLLATGAGQGRALAANLRARGFSVFRRTAYATHPVHSFPEQAAAALLAGHLHAALFLSAETAACFVRLLPAGCNDMLRTVKAVAIGSASAEILGVLPWLAVCRAANPTLDGVLAQL